MEQTLEVLTKAGLYLKPEKCQFHQTEVKYLGLIITTGGIKMDPAKVSTIVDWEPPVNVTGVQCFLGFANFYRRFIRDCSRVSPLTGLTKKENGKYVPFV